MAEANRNPYLQNLSQTGTEIMWGTTSESATGTVHYGTTPGVYSQSVTSSNTSGINTATIGGLAAGQTLYYYVEADGQTIGQNDPNYHFKTAPVADASFRFAVYGDSQRFPVNHTRVVNLIQSQNPDIVVSHGDYVEFGLVDGPYRFNQEFFTPAASMLRNTPFYSGVGNHEAFYTPELYQELFDTPANNPAGTDLYYSFDYGAAHFVNLCSPILLFGDPDAAAAQTAWLQADLAANTRPWTFVLTHYAPFSSGVDPSETVRNEWVPLFEQYGVDMVFSGHDHIYDAYKVNGVTYIVTGGGGGDLDDEYPAHANPPCQICTDFTVGFHACFLDVTENSVVFRGMDVDGNTFQTIVLPEPGMFVLLSAAAGLAAFRKRGR
jgi:acid phosphatase type 7